MAEGTIEAFETAEVSMIEVTGGPAFYRSIKGPA
jgi:hypothetical protein